MAIVGYARVSTTGQSLEAQLNALADCELTFQEKASGAHSERQELSRMLEYIREGDTVKVTKLCRLARNTKHLLEVVELLDSKKVSLQVLNLGIDTASPTGRLMVTLIGAIATFERQLLLERQAEGIALAKSKGKYKGRKPTARDKQTQVRELLAGGMSKSQVAKELGISLSSVYRIKNINIASC
ncbi:putative DNA-invertase from lambdoid prophage Rac [Vibrio crassostreae]|uniref:recombinase family protein n=1 Tax=Vibrio crassostreae TaxID=246167 RepID=UPI0005E96D73|nr:recombinase family protein [Vibrio crassostreae]TCT62599.1 DNA invertase Pin-like site-specific DNA recombinase [Vibrio crassostreae]TCT83358.1 DNA invertase Pin-like site-specific DNA recombinase [Vibrio crassostreae]TCU03769.1 DNA invertase Pin-like site-specific DNA recombinase [Vibrio crassostreae]TDW09509.1 DNA invertase Pin-like site-specific DNA recombinase [Vibrio crassostreae]CAK2048655.1 putative DNA-invertase from lambdoid prophage Rac [Vibrio crassostreae]